MQPFGFDKKSYHYNAKFVLYTFFFALFKENALFAKKETPNAALKILSNVPVRLQSSAFSYFPHKSNIVYLQNGSKTVQFIQKLVFLLE